MSQAATPNKARMGVAGLDDVLGGGLARGRSYLLEGSPGTGKTTIAGQFLMEGAALGETCLYLTLAETEEELRASAASHGWAFDPLITIAELVPPDSLLDPEQAQTLLYSSDLELGETTRAIFEAVQRLSPSRLVLDSLSEVRLLAQSSLRYRRQLLAMKYFFARNGTTALLLDDLTTDALDKTVHSIAHGVIRLEQDAPSYGAERRRLRVVKYRGQNFRGGFHGFNIDTGGVRVFPRLVASEHQRSFRREQVNTGLAPLDRLFGGGLERGTATLVIGPAGVGKSLLGFQFLHAAVRRGERAALFVFEEEVSLLRARARAMDLDLAAMEAQGLLLLRQVDAAEMSPGEFAQMVRDEAAVPGTSTVVIDSLNGYQTSMAEERDLILHMRELLQYLNRQGIVSVLTVAQHGLVGDMRAPVDVTYLADTVALLRYFEAFGRVRRAISVIKKRVGPHEDTIREFRITPHGLEMGEPLQDFQGVLTGVPDYAGERAPLLTDPAAS
jgi:circadian clock protein KaiC